MERKSRGICTRPFSPVIKVVFFISYFFSYVCLLARATADTIVTTESIRDGETLISSGKMFELGFFNRSANRYIGIWYYNISEQTIVWVANRETTVKDSKGSVKLREGGNLVILNGRGSTIWSTNTSAANPTTVKLMDTGSLLLLERKSSSSERILWQSFDYPSDILLPGMEIGMNLTTREAISRKSWKKPDSDLAPGRFVFGLDDRGSSELFISEGSVRGWNSGLWNGLNFPNVFDSTENQSLFRFDNINSQTGIYFNYSSANYTMLVITESGQLITEGEGVQLLRLPGISLKESYSSIVAASEEECRGKCLDDCSCSAYSFSSNSGRSCRIWSYDLTEVQEFGRIDEDRNSQNMLVDLNLRLASAGISLFYFVRIES